MMFPKRRLACQPNMLDYFDLTDSQFATLSDPQFAALIDVSNDVIPPLYLASGSIYSADAIAGVISDAVTSIAYIVPNTCNASTTAIYRSYAVTPDTCRNATGQTIVGGANVIYDGYCVWDSADDPQWVIEGDGAGNWTIEIDPDNQLWVGQKIGTPGTSQGDTPEGSYLRTSGIDTTPSRYVYRASRPQLTGVIA
jgi:hypothetical protein